MIATAVSRGELGPGGIPPDASVVKSLIRAWVLKPPPIKIEPSKKLIIHAELYSVQAPQIKLDKIEQSLR